MPSPFIHLSKAIAWRIYYKCIFALYMMKMQKFSCSRSFGSPGYVLVLKYGIDKGRFAAVGSADKQKLFFFDENGFVFLYLLTQKLKEIVITNLVYIFFINSKVFPLIDLHLTIFAHAAENMQEFHSSGLKSKGNRFDFGKSEQKINSDCNVICKSLRSYDYLVQNWLQLNQISAISFICLYFFNSHMSNPQQGIKQFTQQNFTKAIQHFEEQIKSGRPTYETYIYKGRSQYFLNKFGTAILTYDEAISKWPELFNAYIYKAEALTSIGKYVESEYELRQALRLNDKSCQACYAYAYTLAKMKRYAESMNFYNKGMSRDHMNNPIVYLGTAETAVNLKDLNMAIQNINYAEKALLLPQSSTNLLNMQMNITKDALQKYKAVKKAIEKNGLKLQRTTLQEKQGSMIKKMSQAVHLHNQNLLNAQFNKIMRELEVRQSLINEQGENIGSSRIFECPDCQIM